MYDLACPLKVFRPKRFRTRIGAGERVHEVVRSNRFLYSPSGRRSALRLIMVVRRRSALRIHVGLDLLDQVHKWVTVQRELGVPQFQQFISQRASATTSARATCFDQSLGTPEAEP